MLLMQNIYPPAIVVLSWKFCYICLNSFWVMTKNMLFLIKISSYFSNLSSFLELKETFCVVFYVKSINMLWLFFPENFVKFALWVFELWQKMCILSNISMQKFCLCYKVYKSSFLWYGFIVITKIKKYKPIYLMCFFNGFSCWIKWAMF